MTLKLPEIVWIDIINAYQDKADQIKLFTKLPQLNKQYQLCQQKIRDHFFRQWISWYRAFDGAELIVYEGINENYKHGKYLRFDTSGVDRYPKECLATGNYHHNSQHGDWTIHGETDNGRIMVAQEKWVHGIQVGEQKYYDALGNLYRVMNYDDLGRISGKQTTYLHSTNEWSTTMYEKNQKNGPHTICKVGAGFNILECVYKNDLFEGEYIERWPNKKIKCQTHYHDGKMEGRYEKFHDNGKIHVRRTYKSGVLNGETKTWWRNGKVAECLNYKNGVPDGRVLQFYESGEPKYDGVFKNGDPVGVHRSSTKSGVIVETDYDSPQNRSQ